MADAGPVAGRLVYVWADGVHVNVRLGEQDRLCLLVMIGARPDGTKELIAVEDGYRESAESWAHVLRDLKRRGMRAPVLAIGDGALGFWNAVRDVWPETREQRDWVHRIANVLDKLPKRLQGAEHWKHIRTSNPIESTFATVRLRQRVTKGPGSRMRGLTMTFKLIQMAQKRWRRPGGSQQLPLVRAGVEFTDGQQVERDDIEERKDAA